MVIPRKLIGVQRTHRTHGTHGTHRAHGLHESLVIWAGVREGESWKTSHLTISMSLHSAFKISAVIALVPVLLCRCLTGSVVCTYHCVSPDAGSLCASPRYSCPDALFRDAVLSVMSPRRRSVTAWTAHFPLLVSVLHCLFIALKAHTRVPQESHGVC